MPTPLNSTKAAALIEAQTGRRCSRQNLEKLCERGGLLGSACVLQAKPLRLDADLLVAEYLASVAPFQVQAKQPKTKRLPVERIEPIQPAPAKPVEPPARVLPAEPKPAVVAPKAPIQLPVERSSDLPEYTISRARSEYEKANLLELDRKAKERQLLYREDVEQATGRAVNMTRTKIMGVPSRAKQQIPHLSADEVELIRDLLREALEELAAMEVTA